MVSNSSFILDLRLRSIMLCAVFLAVFFLLDADALACFLLAVVAAGGAVSCSSFGSIRGELALEPGVIWMMVLDLVGGGGREKAALFAALMPVFVVRLGLLRLEDGGDPGW
jgi:hypothetical protein